MLSKCSTLLVYAIAFAVSWPKLGRLSHIIIGVLAGLFNVLGY